MKLSNKLRSPEKKPQTTVWKSKLNTTYLSGSARSAITQVNSLQHFSSAIEKKCKVWMQCAHITKSDLGLVPSTSYLPHGRQQLWWHKARLHNFQQAPVESVPLSSGWTLAADAVDRRLLPLPSGQTAAVYSSSIVIFCSFEVLWTLLSEFSIILLFPVLLSSPLSFSSRILLFFLFFLES